MDVRIMPGISKIEISYPSMKGFYEKYNDKFYLEKEFHERILFEFNDYDCHRIKPNRFNSLALLRYALEHYGDVIIYHDKQIVFSPNPKRFAFKYVSHTNESSVQFDLNTCMLLGYEDQVEFRSLDDLKRALNAIDCVKQVDLIK